MKITVYTTTDCQYCKQEKDYLTANKLTYEEKNLEINKEFLTEMLAISNNFAGTPVTRVEKDDGSIVVLKGFTKGEFDTTFGLVTDKPVEPAAEVKSEPAAIAKEEVVQPPVEAVTSTPADEPKVEPAAPKSNELNSVLDKLEDKTAPEATPAPTVVATAPPSPTNLTDSTDSTNSTNPPSIPDLPDAAKTTA